MKTFEDERGIIEDLKVGKDWSVTYISFKKGAVRGNHYHKQTKQTDIILSGSFECFSGNKMVEMEAGDQITHEANIPHAYKAIAGGEMVSVCHGVRIGENYEDDTFKLEKKLV